MDGGQTRIEFPKGVPRRDDECGQAVLYRGVEINETMDKSIIDELVKL